MSENKARGPMMGGHRSRAMNSGEKAKDFKGAMKRLLKYMERYKFRFVLMFLFAIAGTIFNIVGPKILGKATTELFNGLVAKVNGTGSIDFEKIGYILLWTLGLYLASACFSFIQGYVMTGISNDVTYNLRKDISKKFSRLPMNYYESRTNGEILSRVTNDVDTLQMSLNQSITQLITSVTTLIGVFVMMLTFICVSAFFKTPVYGATFEDESESIADHLADPYSADSDFEFSENQDFCDSVKILSASAVKNVSGLFSAAIKQYGLFICSVIYIAGGIMAAIFVILFKRSVILISRLLLRYSSMKDNRMMSAFSWSFIHK